MSEYIKREAALRIVKNYGKSAIESGRKTLDPVDDIISLATGIDLIPAEDVVEVVRCKDCGNYCKNTGECNKYGCHPGEYGYCSGGKRSERNGL